MSYNLGMNIFEMNLSASQLSDWLGIKVSTVPFKKYFTIDDQIISVKSLAIKPDQLIPLHLNSFRTRFGLVPESFTSIAGADHEGYHNIRHERMTYIRNVSQLLMHYRCLIPATAYFTVILQGAKARAYKITNKNQQPFLMAGLWTTNKRPQIQLTSSGIITQAVIDPSWKEFADRIPVTLDFAGGCEWLRLKKRGKGIWKIPNALNENHFRAELLETMPFSIDASQLEQPRASKVSLRT
jgi:putative SOS response-associated peptidase YedK